MLGKIIRLLFDQWLVTPSFYWVITSQMYNKPANKLENLSYRLKYNFHLLQFFEHPNSDYFYILWASKISPVNSNIIQFDCWPRFLCCKYSMGFDMFRLRRKLLHIIWTVCTLSLKGEQWAFFDFFFGI